MDIMYINLLGVAITLGCLCIAILGSLVTSIWYFARVADRIGKLEAGQDKLREEVVGVLQERLSKVPPSSNPGTDAARRDELLRKFRAGAITRVEAMELNDMLLKEKEKAESRGDAATLVSIILGLALLAAISAQSKK